MQCCRMLVLFWNRNVSSKTALNTNLPTVVPFLVRNNFLAGTTWFMIHNEVTKVMSHVKTFQKSYVFEAIARLSYVCQYPE